MVPQQKEHLEITLQAFAKACDHIWLFAKENQMSQQWHLHQACYQYIRENFRLPANLAIRAIARIAPLLKEGKLVFFPFMPNVLIFDSRTFTLNRTDSTNWSISITLLHGREKFHLDLGNHQIKLLKDKNVTSAVLLKKYKSYYLDIQN
jgi:hypothetical protein